MNARLALGVSLALALLAGRVPAADVPQDKIDKIAKALPEKPAVQPQKARKILIFNRTEGFPHDSIPIAAKALQMMGEKTGAYKADISSDMKALDADSLKQYDVVVLNNTTQLKFDDKAHRQAFMDFVKNGGGVVGIHAATDNFPTWKDGQELIGATFAGHPWYDIPVKIDNPASPLVKPFDGKGFWIHDEIYKMGPPYSREKLQILLSMDMSRMKDKSQSRPDQDNAVAWIQEIGKGRVFYCSLGHVHEIFWNPVLMQFYLNGIQYAAGDLKADATPSAKLSPQPEPAHAPQKAEKK